MATMAQMDDIRQQIKQLLADNARSVVAADATIERAQRADGDMDDDAVYNVRFSSDAPINIMYCGGRFVVEETLSHSRGAVDINRLRNGASLLFNHNRDLPIGVVVKGSVKVEDGAGRCQIRFGKSAKAVEMRANVDDGMLGSVSVGYRIVRQKTEDIKNDAGDVIGYRIMVERWEPTEISLVTVPADTNAKFERDLNALIQAHLQKKEGRDMPHDNNDNKDKPAVVDTISRDEADRKAQEAKQDGATAERERVAGIQRSVEIAKNAVPAATLQTMQRKAVEGETSVADFQAEVLAEMERVAKEDPGAMNPAARLDLSQKDKSKYSIARAIGNLMGWVDNEAAGFERECSAAIVQKGFTGGTRKGGVGERMVVPFDLLAPPAGGERAVTPLSGSGQALIAENLAPQYYIDTLRDNAMVLGAGVQVIAGLRGNIDIPRKTSNGAFSFKALDANTGETNVVFDTLELRMKTASGSIGFTRTMILQATPGVEAIIYRDLARGAALLIDDVVLAGSGAANNPRGIRNTTGVASVTVAGSGITWANIVEMATDLATANALMGKLCYFITPAHLQVLKTTPKVAGYPVFLVGDDMMLNGYPYKVKTQSLGDDIVFGNFEDSVLGVWNFLELQRDTAAASQSGGVSIRAFVDVDHTIRHPESFCVTDAFTA